MRYYVRIFLNGLENFQGLKLKVKKTNFLLGKVRSLKLCPLAILVVLEGNPFVVSHFKALISCQKFWGGQRCGSTLTLWNTILKISILLHNMASDYNQSFIAVCYECLFNGIDLMVACANFQEYILIVLTAFSLKFTNK